MELLIAILMVIFIDFIFLYILKEQTLYSTTDNNNRTVANVRSYFNKCEGNLGTNGSLEFIFDRKNNNYSKF